VPGRRLNLEQLRKQARELLRELRAGGAGAVARWNAQFASRPEAFRLSHAQLVLAREMGFASWPRLKAHVEAPRFVRRRRGPKKLPSRARLEELYAYTLQLVERGDPAAFALETPPKGPYGRTTERLLRALFVERGVLEHVTDLVYRGLEHPNAKVRYECTHALDWLGDDRCVPALAKLLEDPVPRIRAIALHSLVCDDCKLQPLQSRPDLLDLTIEWALNDPHRRVKREAARALAESQQPAALAALERLEPWLRRRVARAPR
jgi:hypothetical protein